MFTYLWPLCHILDGENLNSISRNFSWKWFDGKFVAVCVVNATQLCNNKEKSSMYVVGAFAASGS